MLGRWMADLEVGDVLGPLDRVVSPFLIREYAHGVEESAERHQGADELWATPTIMHAFKKHLLEHACPEGAGPQARLHLVFDATYHAPIPAGATVVLTAEVTGRYDHKGREHITMDFDVRDKATGTLYTSYRDTTLVSYQANPS